MATVIGTPVFEFSKNLILAGGRTREAHLQFDLFIEFYAMSNEERVAGYEAAEKWVAAYHEADAVVGVADAQGAAHRASQYSNAYLEEHGKKFGTSRAAYVALYADCVVRGDAYAANALASVRTLSDKCATIWAALMQLA